MSEPVETSEILQSQIEQLQKKLQVKQLAEVEEDTVEAIDFAIGDLVVTVSKGHEVPKLGVTAPEAALLVAQFHASAGGMPVKNFTNIRTVKIDPRAEKARLSRRYGYAKVEKMYPGAEPKMPQTFKRALGIGAATVLPADSLGDFKVEPMNDGSQAVSD